MFTPKHLVIKRMVPPNNCANVIAFGETKPDKSIKILPTYDDPYKPEEITTTAVNISLFKGSGAESIEKYDASKQINICHTLTDWSFYSIRDLKQMISAFTAVPVAHIDFRTSLESKSLGHVYDEETDTITSIDAFRKIVVLPLVVELYLWGDWHDDNQYARWPEIESAKEGVYTISPQSRQNKEKVFLQREATIKPLAKQETIKGMRGNVISTEISTITVGFGIDIPRLYEFIPLNEQITAIYMRAGDRVEMRGEERDINERLVPEESPAIAVQLLLDADMPKQHKAIAPKHFVITIRDNGVVSAHAGWTDTRGLNNEDILQISRSAIRVLTNLIESMPIEHYTFPVHRFSLSSDALRTTKLSYYELFRAREKGAYAKLQNAVAELAKQGLAIIYFFGEVKMTYLIPVGDSKDRLLKFAEYAFVRGEQGNAQSIWRDKEFRHEGLDKFLFAPKVTVIHEPKSNMIHCKLSNTSNEFEMALSREIFRRTAQLAGFAILPRDSVISIGKVSLTLLDNVDPVLFASRQLSSGKPQTFSRSCQGAAAHPVPVGNAMASKLDPDRVVKLKNFTYGGYQYYYCRNDTHKYPTIRYAGDDWYVPCCISVKYEPGSLKAREYYTGAKYLFYDQHDLEKLLAGLKRSVYLEPVQYNGQELPEGRLATLPKGVRQLFALDIFLFSPMQVNTKSLADVVSSIVGETIELKSKTIGKQLMELLKKSILVAILDLSPVSGKAWAAEILAPENELYGISDESYLIFKSRDNFYPAVNADAKQLKCPQNIIETFAQSRSVSNVGQFSIGNLKDHFVVEKQFVYSRKVYGVLLRSGNDRIYFPIAPTDEVPKIESISLREIKKYMPTMQTLRKFLDKLKVQLEFSMLLKDPRGRVLGFEFVGEPALFLVQPTVDFHNANAQREILVDAAEIQRLIRLPTPSKYHSDIAESSAKLIRITMLYVADRLIRKFPIKRWKPSFGDPKELIKAIERLFTKNVGTAAKFSLHNNIVLFEKPFAMPKTILRGAIARLVEKGPRDFNLFYAYVATLGASIGGE